MAAGSTIFYKIPLGGAGNDNMWGLRVQQVNTGGVFTGYDSITLQSTTVLSSYKGIPNVAIILVPPAIDAGISGNCVSNITTSFDATDAGRLNLILKPFAPAGDGVGINLDGDTVDVFFQFKQASVNTDLVRVVGIDWTDHVYSFAGNTNVPGTTLDRTNTRFLYFGFPNQTTKVINTGYGNDIKGCPNLKWLELPATFTAIEADALNVTALPNAANYPLTTIEVNANISLENNSLRGLKLTKDSILNLRDTGSNDFGQLMVAGLTYKQVYDAITCFGENTKIMCCVDGEEKEVLVQNIRKGTLVKTLLHGYVPVHMIGTSKIHNLANNERYEERLYVCKKEKYPEVTEDLIITGCHSILVDAITDEQRANLMRVMKDIYVTDSKYRLIASLDERAEPYACEGIFNIYHFALENDSYYKNYGVFANGLLVESCSKRYLKELSNMTILE